MMMMKDLILFQRIPKKSIDAKTITKINSCWTNTNYGQIEIASNRNITYQWDFRVKKMDGCFIIFGITDSSVMSPDKYLLSFPKEIRENTYALWSNGYRFKDNDWDYKEYSNDFIKQNDKVSMILNLNTSTLSFLINGSKELNHSNNIKRGDGIKYKMFVTMNRKHDCVELLKFTTV